MEKDERLLPLPNANDLQLSNQDVPANYSPFYDEDSFEEKRSIREYFNVVYKRLPVILALMILTTAVVAFYMYRQPSIFTATTEMIIEPRKPKQQTKDAININFGADANYYQTQLRLLQNPDLMRDVVVRLGLQRDPNILGGQNKGFFSTVGSMFSSEKETRNKESSLPTLTQISTEIDRPEQISLTAEEEERADKYAVYLLNNLTIEQIKNTNLVNIIVNSTNPDLSAKVANTVADVFIEQDASMEMQGAKRAYDELTKSIEDLRGTVAQQEQERIGEMQRSGLALFQGKDQTLNADRLSTLSGQWLAAEDERRKLQGIYEAAQRASGSGDILAVVGDNRAIQDARSQNLKRTADLEKRIEDIDKDVQAAETEKAALLVKYQPEYPGVQIIETKIAALKQSRERIQNEVSEKIKTEGTKLEKNAEREVLRGLQAQLEAAQRRESQLRTAYMSEVSSANQQGQAETRLTTLTREIETNRSLLDTYTQRQKELELAISSSRPDNLKVSAKAQKSTSPVGPNRTRNIFIAFLISLAAGIGLAFLLDYLDDSVKSSDDVGRYLGLPTLALIPLQSSSDRRRLNLLPNKNGNGNLSSSALMTLEDNRSPMAEAYRHLRTSLLFSSAGKPPQTILVTSSQPAEGKTTTAINTAITLAQSGAEVVIIDCDLRRPRLHNHFGLENANGLTNYLSGDRNTESLLKPFSHLPNLKIITSGPIPPNPAELLSSIEMKNLLQFLKGNFKHIVIDSPPAISFTDAAILSTLVDGVVLVALSGKSSIHLMRRFKQRLSTIGARIYGVVINGVKTNSVEYGYYGYSYNYYSPDNNDDSTPLMEEVVSMHDKKN
ncbi:MAG: polysaccharide biosynthesis tyrosine autokinase [Acidobacteria bacterium]|nr:polysaccharide biosynthesis tyrosine autokinase [Acidobacteriota bacterium]